MPVPSSAACRIASRSGSARSSASTNGRAGVARGRRVGGFAGVSIRRLRRLLDRAERSPATASRGSAKRRSSDGAEGCGIPIRHPTDAARRGGERRHRLQRRGHRGEVARLRRRGPRARRRVRRPRRTASSGRVVVAVEQHDRGEPQRGIRQRAQTELGRRALRLRRARLLDHRQRLAVGPDAAVVVDRDRLVRDVAEARAERARGRRLAATRRPDEHDDPAVVRGETGGVQHPELAPAVRRSRRGSPAARGPRASSARSARCAATTTASPSASRARRRSTRRARRAMRRAPPSASASRQPVEVDPHDARRGHRSADSRAQAVVYGGLRGRTWNCATTCAFCARTGSASSF